MRILGEQLTRLTRALGNMFIPILIKIVPYVQAFVMVLTDAAQAVANFLGFKLPTIDYSGMEGLSSGADNAAESLGNAATAAKKLKDYTLGIDELNVISKDTGAQGGTTGGGGMGSDLGIKLPEYDFLGDAKSKVNEIIDNFKKGISAIEKTLKPIMPLVKGIGAALLAAFGVKKIIEFASSVKKWSFMTSLFSKITNAALGFHTVFEGTGKLLPSISAGFKTFRDSLSFATKAIVGIGSVIGVFVVFEETVRNCALGTQSLESAIAVMVVATAGFGTLLYATLGPIGLVAGALAGITGAAIGYSIAQDEIRSKMVAASVFDGIGLSLNYYTDSLSASTAEINAQNKIISEWGTQLQDIRDKINDNVIGIQTLSSTLGLEGAVTASEISNIKSQFNELYEKIKNSMNLSKDIIVTALASGLKTATPEISAQIDVLIGEYMRFVRETQGRSAELKLSINNSYDDLIGKVAGSTEYNAIMKDINGWYTELGALSGGMSDASWKWKDAVSQINENGLDFGKDTPALMEKLKEIQVLGEDALKGISDARAKTLSEIDKNIAYAVQYRPAELSMLGDQKKWLEDDYARQSSDISAQIESIFGEISSQMGVEAGKVAQNAFKSYDNLNWAEKFWNGDKYNYAAQMVENFNKDIYAPLSREIHSSASSLGLDSKKMGLIIMDEVVNGIKSSWTGRNVPNETMKMGIDAVMGLSNGIKSSSGEALDAIKKLANDGLDAYRIANDSHSPSKKYISEGKNIVNGITAGIKDNASFATNQLETLAKDSLKAFEKANGYNGKQFIVYADYGKLIAMSISQGLVKNSDSAISALNDLGTQLKNSLADTITDMRRIANENKVTVSVVTEYTSKNVLTPTAPVKRYAMGGFPERGQMFIANEAGPELVGNIGNRTAVANNTQILDGITASMTNANQEQNGLLREQNGLLRALLNKETGVNLVVGDDVIGRANSRYESQRGVRISTGVFADAY